MPESSPRGTFRKVADLVRAGAPGEGGLVRESAVAREHHVARTTARRALKALEEEGFLRPEPGVGWRVLGGEPPRSLPRQMADLIHENALSIGDPFPSEAALCELFKRSRPTIRRALAALEADGVLLARPGKGRTVMRVPEVAARPEVGVDETD